MQRDDAQQSMHQLSSRHSSVASLNSVWSIASPERGCTHSHLVSLLQRAAVITAPRKSKFVSVGEGASSRHGPVPELRCVSITKALLCTCEGVKGTTTTLRLNLKTTKIDHCSTAVVHSLSWRAVIGAPLTVDKISLVEDTLHQMKVDVGNSCVS